jgi:hypothetical protein
MEKKEQILTSSLRLVQQRGLNGFSYADIADFSSRLDTELTRISALPIQDHKKLATYIAIYRGTL